MRYLVGEEVYRGVVEVRTTVRDEYGNPVPAVKRQYVGPYDKRGTARGQATVLSRQYPQKDVVDSYVEVCTGWQRS